MLSVKTFFEPGTDVMKGPRKAVIGLLLLMLTAFFVFVTWAFFAKLEVTVFSMGKVVPSAQLQVVQNLEGGIIEAIHVSQGERVKKGQTLLVIDSIGFEAYLKEQQAEYWGLLAKSHRLQTEANGGNQLVFPKRLNKFPKLLQRERTLFLQREEDRKVEKSILQNQLEQKELAYQELTTKIKFQKLSVGSAIKELNANKPLLITGSISEIELLALEEKVNQLDGELQVSIVTKDRVSAEIREATARVQDQESTVKSEALAEFNEVTTRLEALTAIIKGQQDKVARRAVKSPVDGVVNRLLINTIGGVSQPGDDLLEIVPVEDELLIELRVYPKDIGFIALDQKATIRFTAYDSSIFGSVDGEVHNIGADTLTDPEGNTFYQVIVRADDNYLGSKENPLLPIPGMEATAHITTGERTVMDYIIKPIVKLRDMAIRER